MWPVSFSIPISRPQQQRWAGSGTPPRPARSTQPGVFSCSSGPRRRRGVLEGHGVGPRPSRGELVPDVPEDLLAAPLPIQLPFLGMPSHTRTGRRRPRGHPLASEVVGRGEEVIVSGLPGFGDVRAHLPPRPTGTEAPADGVPEGLAGDAPAQFAAVAVGPAAYPAVDARSAHHLGHGLVGDPLAQLDAQAHGQRLWPQSLAVVERISTNAPRAAQPRQASSVRLHARQLACLGKDPLGMP